MIIFKTLMVKKHTTGSIDTKLNLDGLVDSGSDEDEVKPGKRRNKLNTISSSDEDVESKPRSKKRGRAGKQASKRAKVESERSVLHSQCSVYFRCSVYD